MSSNYSLIKLILAAFGKNQLLGWGYAVEWKTYPMMHQVCYEETQDISGWLNRVFA